MKCGSREWMSENPSGPAMLAHLSWCRNPDCVEEFTTKLDLLTLSTDEAISGLQEIVADLVPFEAWLEKGINEGYCSTVACNTHDGLPTTNEEEDLWEQGDDPCVPAVRLYWPEAA